MNNKAKNVMTKKLGCKISEEDKIILDRLTKELNLNQEQLISYLLKNYQPTLQDNESDNQENNLSLESFKLSEPEKQEINKALINSNSQLNIIAKEGLLQRSRYLNSIASKQLSLESMTDEEMSKATFKGAANYRIEKAINIIINHNDMQGEKSQKVCLTRGIVFKLTGSNRQTINEYFYRHGLKINDHNYKHELTETDNRKGKGFDYEKLLNLI